VPLPSSNAATLTLSPTSATDAGSYTVTVSNTLGSATSRPAQVVVTASPPPSTGLLNLSTRTNTGKGSAALTPGFVLAGSGQKEGLIRAVGPGLTPFELTYHASDPAIELFKSTSGTSTRVGENDNGSVSAIGDAFTRAGAFADHAGQRRLRPAHCHRSRGLFGPRP
jgi:hypothetical protein